MADIQVKLVKSVIGSTKSQIDTVHSLGLFKIGDVSVQPDIPATQGKVKKVAHLVAVIDAKQGGANA